MKPTQRIRSARLALLCVAGSAQIVLGQGLASPSPTATEVPPACTGDCNRDGVVTVDELVAMAGIALGDTPFVACADGVGDGQSQVRMDAVIAAVNAAVKGCTGPTTTPTASPVPSPTPPICGNGRIEPPEQCDDQNLVQGDGCDSHCQIEPSCQCHGEPSVCGCIINCQLPNALCSVPPATFTPTATPTLPP